MRSLQAFADRLTALAQQAPGAEIVSVIQFPTEIAITAGNEAHGEALSLALGLPVETETYNTGFGPATTTRREATVETDDGGLLISVTWVVQP